MNIFLVMYDSNMTIEEERMIEVALKEAVELYPNLNLLLMQPDTEESNMADVALQKARSKDGAVNAIDILRIISKGADDNYAITITSKKMYVNPKTDLGINAPEDIDVTDISSDNAALYSISETRALEMEDQMHLMQHYICDYIGQLAYGLEHTCEDPKCMMQVLKTKNLAKVAFMEEHAKKRLCEKCRKKLLARMSIDERIAPSYLDII